MRISDWSSDVCSSDLRNGVAEEVEALAVLVRPGRADLGPVRILAVAGDAIEHEGGAVGFGGHVSSPSRCRAATVAADAENKARPIGRGVMPAARLPGRGSCTDRKSTRLNSSH